MSASVSTTIAFDMDGVLIDSAESIASALTAALDEIGVTPNRNFDLRSHIGKPLDALIRLSVSSELTQEQIAKCKSIYRRVNDNISPAELKVFPKVREMLEECSRLGHLVVLTTKNESSARRQLQTASLSSFFVNIFGNRNDERPTTKDIRWLEAEADLCAVNIPRIALIIGDRASDIFAAKKLGRSAIGVSWGYGTPEELRDSRPFAIANDPRQIPDLLKSMLDRGAKLNRY